MIEKNFCTNCRKETGYTMEKRTIERKVRDEKYTFNITVAVCNECKEEMSIPGLIDQNIKEVDEQYRAYEDIISIADIQKLMELYNIGKAPLSLVLGFGEITITRYLAGQMPSKEYSDIMKKALSSPKFMKEKLLENNDKIASTAFNKAMAATIQLETLFSVSNKMLRTIAYLFEQLEEVTPLMLQKLLYFIQGVTYALNDKPMFTETCQAWVHGPVYPEVYNIFRDFKYNPIEDVRFAIFKGREDELTNEERKVIDLVINTFGQYGGKVLERITHIETPWQLARIGYGDGIPSNKEIKMNTISDYYKEINDKYDFSSEDGINKYIRNILQ